MVQVGSHEVGHFKFHCLKLKAYRTPETAFREPFETAWSANNTLQFIINLLRGDLVGELRFIKLSTSHVICAVSQRSRK